MIDLSSEVIDNSRNLRTKYSHLKTQFCKPAGFTMIELLIVLSILGVAATLVTASYLGFEKRERVKSAALEMKNQIRFAQNRALSGDKGFGTNLDDMCPATSTLVGWYVNIDKARANSYFIAGDCLTDSNETDFDKETKKLPEGVSIVNITYNTISVQDKNNVNILFRPLENDSKFFDAGTTSVTPPFFDTAATDIDVNKLFDKSRLQESVTVTISGFNTAYEVEIEPTGEVNERKI